MVNWIKIENDHDDVNVIVSFSGKAEWETILALIEHAYVYSQELEKDLKGFRPSSIDQIYNDISNLGNIIYNDK